jgi:hypothetical protein
MNKLQNFYKWLLQENTGEFSTDKLKTLKTLEQIKQYIIATLGSEKTSGSFRSIWFVDDSKIIKVVDHEKSAKQNRKEVQHAECLGTKFAPKIYEYDELNYFWVIEERLEVFYGDELYEKLEKILGYRFSDWQELKNFFAYAVADTYHNDSDEQLREFEYLKTKLIARNQWFRTLVSELQGCEVGSRDFHDENWGMRPATGEVVLLDLGF